MSSIRSVVVVGIALILSSCGGSSGGSKVAAFTAQTLSGTYHLVSYAPRSGPRAGAAAWGSLVSDGVSQLTSTVDENDDTTVSAGLMAAFDYAIGTDGTLSLFVLGSEVFRGGVSSDGSCAVVSSLISGTPRVIVLVRKAGVFNNGLLTGTYGLGLMGVDTSGAPMVFTVFGETTLNGGGGISGSVSSKTEAAAATAAAPITGTYAVAADGVIDVTLGTPFRGGVSEDQELLVASGGINNGNEVGVVAFAKRGTGMSNMSWLGEYWMVGCDVDPTDDCSTFAVALTADGAGNVSVTGNATDEGSTSMFTGTATYSVDPAGVITLMRGADVLTGQLSATGRYVVLSGTQAIGGEPVLWIACKK